MTRVRDKANSTLTSGSEGDQCSALSLPLPSDILPDAKDEKPTVVHIVQPPGGRVREQSGERWRVDLERRKEELTVQKLLPLSPVSSYLYLQLALGTLHLDVSFQEFICQCRRHTRCGFNPWVRKIPWRRKWQPLQYSCLENPMDRGAWQAIVHGVTKSRTEVT